jgi:hypothetical protein
MKKSTVIPSSFLAKAVALLNWLSIPLFGRSSSKSKVEGEKAQPPSKEDKAKWFQRLSDGCLYDVGFLGREDRGTSNAGGQADPTTTVLPDVLAGIDHPTEG